MFPTKTERNPRRSMLEIAGPLALLIVLGVLIWTTARSGFAALLTANAARGGQMVSANAAVGLGPRDPDAHLIRAVLLLTNDDPEAIAEFEKAVSLRPADYVLWLNLARGCEQTGDTRAAVAAGRRAAELAPYYAQPHWQLGNILVRAGRKTEGFQELRLAGTSNPTLMPGIIDLAWRLSSGDANFVKQSIQPATPEVYRAVARYFRKQGNFDAAIEMYVSAGSAPNDQEERAVLKELISAKRFTEAYRFWGVRHQAGLPATLNDSGFELESDLSEPGFGWHSDSPEGFQLFRDATNPRQGGFSLRVDFNGNSDPSVSVISQLVLVEPRVHYQLRFATRTEGILSGGLPSLLVSDAANDNMLGQPQVLPRDTSGWQEYAIDFSAGESTAAVQIRLRRQSCAKSPCPIFGHLWLDNFSLQKL